MRSRIQSDHKADGGCRSLCGGSVAILERGGRAGETDGGVEMKAGDRVRFRGGSRGWKSRGLDPAACGLVVDLYRVPPFGEIKADVRFAATAAPERGISVDELEVVREFEPPLRS